MKRGINKTKKYNFNIFTYIIKSLFIIVTIAILYNVFLVIFSAKTNKEAKYILGFRAYVITTDSMKPNLSVGDIVIVQKTENDNLYVNDVITYRLSNDLERITHRIVDKSTDVYITKGDNNKLEDKNMVKYENIEGKVIFKIPFLGKLFFKLENLFYVFFLGIIILTMYLYQRRLANKSQIRRAKKKYADLLKKELKTQVEEIEEEKTEVKESTRKTKNNIKNKIIIKENSDEDC